MSFLKKLFGGGQASGPKEPEAAPAVEYQGYTIVAAPQEENGQYRLAGTITKMVDETERVHQLIRADLFSDRQEAVSATERKARQVIDEQGQRLFS